jgi:hypothetical protein
MAVHGTERARGFRGTSDGYPSGMSSSGARFAGHTATRRQIFRHPWRVAIVVAGLLVVVNLVIFLGVSSDTSDQGQQGISKDVLRISPGRGSIVNPLDDVEVRLRSGLTGVLVLNGTRLPEDQLVIDTATSTITFRPGPGKEIDRLPAGANNLAVLYWRQTEAEPPPGERGNFGWSFRVAA